jgi:hypothetical protein
MKPADFLVRPATSSVRLRAVPTLMILDAHARVLFAKDGFTTNVKSVLGTINQVLHPEAFTLK